MIEHKDKHGNENMIEGRNAVLEAFRSGKPVDKLFVLDGCQDGPVRTIVREAKKHDTLVQFVDKERLTQLSQTGRHQGVIAYTAAYEYAQVEDMLALAKERGEDPFLILLDDIEDPHNLGAIIRTANLAGAHGVIIPKRRAVGLTATVAKTSAGAINYTPVAKVTNLTKTMKELKEKGLWFVCADMGGESMYKLNLTGPIGLVIGNEGEGVSRLVKETCDFVASIPMKGDIDSVLRILLLKDIIQKNLELENYEQAFYFASQIPTPLKSESLIQINLIEENLKNTMSDKVDDKNPSLIIGRWILVGGLLATILFVCYNKKRKSLRSKKQDLPDKEMEALTLQQLYDQCSEKYPNGSVFVVDLVNFKKFNETYGYIAGDQVIEQVFELIKSEFKEGLLTRHNGQQFIIVTQDDKMRAAQRAQQLIDKTYALNIEHVTNLRDLRMTLSVGIVCGNLDSSINLDKYLKKAQDLVLISKEKGKNRLTI